MFSWVSYFLKTPKIPFLLGVLIISIGLLATNAIPKESAPALDYGIITVSTSYSGANALDIDNLITEKIESKIQSLTGIDSYSSTSQYGFSSIVISLDTGVNIAEAVADVRSKVDEAKSDLPSDLITDPLITSVNSSEKPFTNIVLYGNKNAGDISHIAKNLETQLESVSGVLWATTQYFVPQEINISLRKKDLESQNISFSEVQSVLLHSQSNTPLGNFEISGKDYSLRFQAESESLEDFKNLEIRSQGNSENSRVIHLEDIANISLVSNDESAITRFYKNDDIQNIPQNAVVIEVSKKTSSDLFETQKKVDSVLEKYFSDENIQNENISNLHYFQYRQESEIMKDDFSELFQSSLTSLIVVLLFIFVFIGFQEGFLASLIIPLSFLGTIAVLFFSGRTLNFMTNFSMILALGILVDTAIVIVEGTRQAINNGLKGKEAALYAVKEFGPALFSGMLTTISVFLPLFFLPGIVGQYLSFIPITVTIVLSLSLFIALVLISTYSSIFLQPEEENEKKSVVRKKINNAISWLITKYSKILRWMITGFFRRWILFFLAIVSFITSFFLPIAFDFFPSADSDTIELEISFPVGMVQEKTSEELIDIEKKLLPLPEIESIISRIKGNKAIITLNLYPMKERSHKELLTSQQLENSLLDIYSYLPSYIELQVKREKNGPPSPFPVGFRVVLDSPQYIDQAKQVVKDLKKELRLIEGTQGVSSNLVEIPGEIEFTLDKEAALKRNIDPLSIPAFIRGALQGVIVSTYSHEGTDIDVVLQLESNDLQTVENILDLEIAPNIPLKSVVHIEYKDALSQITRHEGDLSFTVFSFLTETGNTEVITQKILDKIENNEIFIPKGIRIDDGSENAENSNLMKTLQVDLFLAIFLIFLILVVQFKSYSPPLLILQTIIFAQTGVNIGLFLTDTAKSMPYMLGTIALAGIVVNDAIILLDKIQKNITSGKYKSQYDALIEAGTSRFIPVVLTTLTTSAGIFPLVFVDSFWEGLAYTIIFGLSFATILTLFFIPLGYILFQKKVK